MHEMSLIDLIAFFAILPAHKDFFEGDQARQVCPKLTRWAEQMMDNSDLFEYLQAIKIKQSAIALAKTTAP